MLVLLLLAGGSVLLVGQARSRGRDSPGPATAPAPRTPVGADRDVEATRLLRALGRRLETGSRSEVAVLAGEGDASAVRRLTELREAVRAIGIVDLDWRLVPPGRPPSPGVSTWPAAVTLRWRTAGMDAHDGSAQVSVRLRDLGGRVGFVSAAASPGHAAPGWLLGPVRARRGDRWQVVVAEGRPVARFARLARGAVAAVSRVLPGWRGRLVVEVPAGQAQLDRVLGERAGSRARTAAVTTTVDGSLRPTAPVHVFVNPDVLDPLGPRASQVVVSHEATHVATRAVFASVPSWLTEGFADYVALDHLGLPPSVPAADLLARVRRDGPPARLPTRADFDATRTGAGAAYEGAWLACRLIARTYGEARLVDFYRAADRSSSTTDAFGSVLGTDLRRFTRAWRRELSRLAGVP